MSTDLKKWDFKQLGAGGAMSLVAMFMLQDRGIDFINQKQSAQNDVIIEKTLANASRINKLESAMDSLSKKIDIEFSSLRKDLTHQTDKLLTLVRESGKDKWTSGDHHNYSEMIDTRIRRVEDHIRDLEKGCPR